MEHSSRDEILAQTLMEMQSAEPEDFENSKLCDSNAEHTIGMWQIWTTEQSG